MSATNFPLLFILSLFPLQPSHNSQLTLLFSSDITLDDDDEGAFSACQCLDTIGGVLDAVQERGDTMAKLEILVMPLLQKYVLVLILLPPSYSALCTIC